MAWIRCLRPGSLVLLAAFLSACGGGGGGGDQGTPPTVRPALPTLVQDSLPTGERLDLRARNYFPAQAGDSWTYDLVQGGVTTAGGGVLTVLSASGNDAWFSETVHGQTVNGQWRRTAEGVISVDPLAGAAPAAVRTLVGDMLEYPEPFYAVGAERRAIRQGSWGEDLDGDGVAESFRLEVVQVLVGFETLSLPLGSAETAHFRSTTTLTVSPSMPANAPVTVLTSEDSWWAPGVGRVYVNRVAVDGNGASLQPAYALRISSGTVAGQALFQPQPDGTVVKLALPHRALVFDRSRGVYYASVPASAGASGNSIAIIDATTGGVRYSAAVGSDPGALAVAADGSALYVALDGSGEVLRLTLPAMQEVYRTRLPVSGLFGQLLAEQLAVSPVDPDAVAVSLRRTTVTPRHGGVALIRSGVLQPQRTPEFGTGSNLIAFAADGQWLYGYETESSGFGLSRIEVLADGLAQRTVVATNAGYSQTVMDVSAQGPLLGDTQYRGSDLALLGRVSAPGGGCRLPLAAARLLCLQEGANLGATEGHVVVADANSFVTLAAPAYAVNNPPADRVELVPGPAGQVALRVGLTYFAAPASGVWLFTSPQLP